LPSLLSFPTRRSSDLNAVLILLLVLTGSCGRQRDSKPSAAQARAVYATPADVFEACKEAEWKGEWRKCFDCYTPDAQNNMMFGLDRKSTRLNSSHRTI